MSAHWFSRIQLDAQHPQATEALCKVMSANAYQDHQWFWRAFFPAPAGAARDYIFRRVEGQDSATPPMFYAVSQRPPEQPHAAWKVETREYRPEIAAGQTLAFELRANPVVTRESERQGKSTRRHEDVVMHAKKSLLKERGLNHWRDWKEVDRPALYELVHRECSQWLAQQAARHGFVVATGADTLKVDGYRRHTFHNAKAQHDETRKSREIVLSTVDFFGRLQVQDANKFQQALLNGLGHGKAFGCGLLLVRRA